MDNLLERVFQIDICVRLDVTCHENSFKSGSKTGLDLVATYVFLNGDALVTCQPSFIEMQINVDKPVSLRIMATG